MVRHPWWEPGWWWWSPARPCPGTSCCTCIHVERQTDRSITMRAWREKKKAAKVRFRSVDGWMDGWMWIEAARRKAEPSSHGGRHADQGRKPHIYTHMFIRQIWLRPSATRTGRGLPSAAVAALAAGAAPAVASAARHPLSVSLDLANKNTDELNWTKRTAAVDRRPAALLPFYKAGGAGGQPSGRPRGAGSGCSRDVRSYAPAPHPCTALAVAVHAPWDADKCGSESERHARRVSYADCGRCDPDFRCGGRAVNWISPPPTTSLQLSTIFFVCIVRFKTFVWRIFGSVTTKF
jgi:hypothetical protein